MIAFEVNDMTCGHCVSSITKAVKALDRNAAVQIDLTSHRVEIQPAEADAQTLSTAIADAGFTPVLIESAAPAHAAQVIPAKRGGCCCR